MLLTIFGLSDEAVITMVCMVMGGLFSLAGVYIALRLSINTLQTNQLNDKERIVKLEAALDKTNDALWGRINDIMDILTTIKQDIEKIRP